MLLFRQIAVLVWKQLLLSLVRAPITTPLRALILPIVFSWFLSYAKNFFIPYAVYGIADSSSPIRPLHDALQQIGNGRTTVAIVRNNLRNGPIDQVISNITSIVSGAGKIPQVVEVAEDLVSVCPSTLVGGSPCIAALEFFSSPSEPQGAIWNYTLFTDGALGSHPDVTWNQNDPELYALPLQHAVDWAIADLDDSITTSALPTVREFPFTSESRPEHDARIRRDYAQVLIDVLGVGFFIAICGVSYQQVGAHASETEIGISKLLETMAPNKRRWEPQLARFTSYWISFACLYIPGWIIMAIIMKVGVFASSNVGVLIVLHLLTGFALCSQALFIAALFKRAQLSGISAVLANLILAIIAQVFDTASNSTVGALSFFFPSMNYVYFIVYMARFERRALPTDLTQSAPNNPWTTPGIVFWVFMIIQIIAYPIAGALVERALWGTASTQARREVDDDHVAVELKDFRKVFKQNRVTRFFTKLVRRKPREDVVAVKQLDLQLLKGSILVLLGANGSGKSSTLNAVAGLSTVTSGTVAISSPGLGYCPQTNVLWSKLTVAEHLKILGRWKATEQIPSEEQRMQLIDECDLTKKVKTKAGALSGGQQRKLQLALCFISGSQVTLIDEVSSGIDPLARRKIQNIILAERLRSNRSVIFTTHFLDEAEAVGDHIAILSKGFLKTSGSVPEIKQSAGGYRVIVQKLPGNSPVPPFECVGRIETSDEIILEVSTPVAAVEILNVLEPLGHHTSVHGPSLEDVFMKVAEEMSVEAVTENEETPAEKSSEKKPEVHTNVVEASRPLNLDAGQPVGPLKQFVYLIQKRWTVFRRNPFPNLAAMLLPLIAAGLVTLFLVNFNRAGCTPDARVSASDPTNLGTIAMQYPLDILAGPQSRLGPNEITLLTKSLGLAQSTTSEPTFNLSNLGNSIHFAPSLDQFSVYLSQNYHNITPGGLFFDPDGSVTFAYVIDYGLATSVLMQNLVDTLALNIPISTQYNTFSTPWQADQGKTLQFCIYFGLVMSIAPAFFGLYPTAERLRKVRQHQYSNGVRPVALWPAYLVFDMMFMVVGITIAIIIFAGVKSSVFFDLGLFWVALMLYGLTGTLITYAISLYANSQLAAFAFSAAFGAISFLLYLIGFLATQAYAPTLRISAYETYVYFTMAIILPAGSLLRAIFVSLNILNINCRGISDYVAHGNQMLAYGGPITYPLVQALALVMFLIWWESGQRFGWMMNFLQRKSVELDSERHYTIEPEVQAELKRAEAATTDGLTVLHLTKMYKRFVAVDNISFGVEKGTIFALLGPNGGGKTSTISTISGDLRPTGGHIAIDNVPLQKHRSAALQRLGLCPQFDALDSLTVTESLSFYAKIRGLRNVESNVKEIIRAVGLVKFKDRLSLQLSGGNKRRLSLAIALLGNPALILLDEPSSGMDIAAKRIMWSTLRRVSSGRSMVLVTHSMEEADALATRAGVLATRFLAFGTSSELRERHGNKYYVHLVMKSAPYTSDHEIDVVRDWILHTFAGAEVEDRTGHGQLRFSVPARGAEAPPKIAKGGVVVTQSLLDTNEETPLDIQLVADKPVSSRASSASGTATSERCENSRGIGSGIASVFTILEASKGAIGYEYSIAQTTLDQVFLNVVQKHNIEEENYRSEQEKAGQEGGAVSSQGMRRRRWFRSRK